MVNVPRLTLRTEERPGEPVIFSDDPAHRLTDDQFDDLRDEFNEAITENQKREEIVERLPYTYSKDLAEFLNAHPDRSRQEFDQEDLRYNMLAAQQLVESESKAISLRYRMMRTGMYGNLPYVYDFPMVESDEKHREPRAAAQLEAKARKFPEALSKVDGWMESLLRPWYLFHEEDIAGIEQPPLDRWKAAPVGFQDLDRYSIPSMDETWDIDFKQQLLKKYAADCEDLRDELLLMKSHR